MKEMAETTPTIESLLLVAVMKSEQITLQRLLSLKISSDHLAGAGQRAVSSH
jgi:hypothetical protein